MILKMNKKEGSGQGWQNEEGRAGKKKRDRQRQSMEERDGWME